MADARTGAGLQAIWPSAEFYRGTIDRFLK